LSTPRDKGKRVNKSCHAKKIILQKLTFLKNAKIMARWKKCENEVGQN
jgi:hypothetical protein